jgi:hypothetical protein
MSQKPLNTVFTTDRIYFDNLKIGLAYPAPVCKDTYAN